MKLNKNIMLLVKFEKTIQVNSISLYARILKQEGSLNASILKYEEAIEISKQTTSVSFSCLNIFI